MKRILLTLSILSLSAVAAPAWSQQITNPANFTGPAGVGVAKPPARSTEKPPSALPGARAEPAAVAPASKNSLDLPPNEALFDAINRGDMAVAKDAVNRGADLNATNVLGLTPIELAVDLGRNQLSFYLLSLRGGAAGTTVSGPPAEEKPPSRAERLAALRAERAEKAARQRPVADAAPAAPRTARLFAGNGGAPAPQAGFLGFDANR